MTQQKFVSIKKNKLQKNNDWFEQCKKEKIPYIFVEARSKYADVQFDYISLPAEYCDHLSKNVKQITDKANAIFQKYANKGSKCTVSASGLLVNFEKIPIDKAEKTANELFDLVVLFLPA